MRNKSSLLLAFVCMGLFCLSLFYGSRAHAHGVYIYAWADPNGICTDSYFSKKSKVRNGEVQALSQEGKLLFSAHTDNEGKACFPLPVEAVDIEFIILAGEGHRGSFKLRKEDIEPYVKSNLEKAREDSPLHGTTTTAEPEQLPDSLGEDKNTDATSEATPELLRQIVREELKLQLAPLRQQLLEQEYDQSPGLREVFAGLGWILALALISYITLRRKR